MHRTNIEWTDLAANPLQYRDKGGKVVWACVKHSTGCAHCYAEALAQRYNRGGPFTTATVRDLTPFLAEEELYHILTAQKIGGAPVAGKRCFLGDMTDVFGEWVSDELLDRLFAALAMRRDVTFQVLTKRADRMAAYFSTPDRKKRIAAQVMPLSEMLARQRESHTARLKLDAFSEAFAGWGPIRNLWLGVSVENQSAADERIPQLLNTPAAVRFLSCEPLLSAVDLSWWFNEAVLNPDDPTVQKLHWAIVGCESGPGRRATRAEWAESLAEQCRAAGVACFVKQIEVGGKVCGDANQFPQQLRVREYPPAVK